MNKAAIISQLEKKCSQTLLTLLDDMFASCDDLFFDMASRATSNAEQNLYFESMREIRVKTRAARNDYEKGLIKGFQLNATKKNHASQFESTAATQTNKVTMELVDKEDVEQDVAISNMSTRARAVSKKRLYELHLRLQQLYDVAEVNKNNNPLDPGVLSELFSKVIQNMGIDIKARIILLKQYERYIINRLPELYKNTCKLLEDAGIRFSEQRKTKQQRSGSGSRQSSPLTQTFNEDELPLLADNAEANYRYGASPFDELSQLLSNLRSLPGQQQANQPSLFSSGNGPALQNNELINLLNQHITSDTSGDLSGKLGGHSQDHQQGNQYSNQETNTIIDLRAYIGQLLARGMPKGQTHAVQQVDEDVINLVAMFFDFVLDDKNIPDNIKAVVSRLQMPILKIALKDKRFFSDTEHPARNFINEIARISIGIDESDPQADTLLLEIEQWVQKIQTTTDNIEAAFTESLIALKAYHQKNEKRADLVQKRTSEAAEGQAKRQVATLRSQQAIQDAMDGKSLAALVSEFIVKQWQQVLYVTFVKEGEESQTWLSHLQTMQDLIWCSQPHQDEKSQQRYKRIVENLFVRLAKALEQTTLNSTQITEQTEQLKTLIEKIANPKTDPEDIIIETFQADSDDALQSLQQQKSWGNMTALERQKVQFQALTYDFIEQADAISLGTWLEFKTPGNGAIMRCKLAAKLASSDSYVFVNRLGFKAIEKPRKEFAFDLQRKRARLLRSGPLFERSLHKVVTRLKNIT
ncbi:DUF1631 domain-containing protein [Pseudomonadales bacterium]|nr:DUF1631 domain-containing protein [Pseudomonadales bacterium]